MRILHVVADLDRKEGGPVTAVLGLAKAQAAMGHRVRIICTDDGFQNEGTVENLEIKNYPCRWRVGHYSPDLARALALFLEQTDITHIHDMWDHASWAGADLCRRKKIPYILSPHGMLERWSLSRGWLKKKIHLNLFGRRMIRHAASIHWTTQKEKKDSSLHGETPETFICPLGISASAFSKLPPSSSFGKRFPQVEGKRFILFLGRMHVKKQPDLLIEAFDRIRGRHPEMRLVMAGCGSIKMMARLQRIVEKLELTSRVIFTGMLDEAAAREALTAADVFVLLSLQENFGLSILEAMAAACPVIVSHDVGVSDLVSASGSGLVVEANVEALVQALQKLLAEPEARQKMGQCGRREALSKFTWESIASLMQTQYDRSVAVFVGAQR